MSKGDHGCASCTSRERVSVDVIPCILCSTVGHAVICHVKREFRMFGPGTVIYRLPTKGERKGIKKTRVRDLMIQLMISRSYLPNLSFRYPSKS